VERGPDLRLGELETGLVFSNLNDAVPCAVKGENLMDGVLCPSIQGAPPSMPGVKTMSMMSLSIE
jgi:hypothetical protein